VAAVKPPVVVARARRPVPAAPSASALKAARCRSSAACPKRGFNNARFTTKYNGVNVSDLNKFDDGARVDELAMSSVGLSNGTSDGIKILGNGELTKKLTVIASAFSASAKTKIEAKGGTCEVVSRKPAPAAKA